MLDQVSGGSPTPEVRYPTLGAALLHDIGHGPFSHAIEAVTGVHHEEVSAAVIQDPGSSVHRVLAEVDPDLPASVAALLHHGSPRTYYGDIISSQLDADRLDYILRDGLLTGVKIAMYDLERILRTLCAAPNHLLVSPRATEAIEGYLLARFHMFKQVYLHKAVRSAEKMLEASLRRAATLLRSGSPDLEVPPGPLSQLLSGAPLDPIQFVTLDDTDVWVLLKAWSGSSDPVLSELAGGLVSRRLYKTMDVPPTDREGLGGPIDLARSVIQRAGGDPNFHLLVDRAADTPYSPYDPDGFPGQRPIMIGTSSSESRIETHSDIVHLLGRERYEIQRICFPARFRDRVAAALQG
jgi:HD superfamily phosphohydrolase